MIRIKILAFLLIAFTANSYAQTPPFQIAIEPMDIPDLGGLQAYAFGQDNGKWLIIGGRLDGLHRRQPFAAFDVAGLNTQITVVDPVTQQKWSAPLASLPTGLREQLSSTNMEFYQQGDYLYILGGYGYSNTAGDHITYSKLSAVHVPDVINAIVNGASIISGFRQITDTMFAVTGGYLSKINDIFYLTGGQKFMGRYNPMGPDHGPGFIQNYSNSIRRFTILDDGVNLSVSHLPLIYDATNLHRRDLNVVPQIMPSGQEGLTVFSGVFQVDADLPFLNCVNIDINGYTVNNDFSQYYNHYHCAHIPLYSAENNEMHTVFFGGIAQYYESDGELVQDDNVPFVKTIARVTRDASGTMAEYKLPIEMPAFLGAGSEFIPAANIPQFNNEVLKLDDFTADTTLVGYIYGGISSTAANIFFTNDGTQSSASSQIFKVYVIKNSPVGIHELNKQSTSTLHMQVYPNPNNGNFIVKFNLKKSSDVTINIQDANGRLIENTTLKNLKVGENTYSKEIEQIVNGGMYYITIETGYEKATQKIVVEN
ncbi:T9SS type A sorting domain-containing protein [Cryomorpha ignava]|uniref:T9SS type A sorting domain-containing protein n=1 Tax=Cryomorpha ignava TaxID=101383 RepID=A0A7K3WSB3_9FLAO|nr:T9SS type A sorting domain-containing protein [Cryomorpha ignava]NEN24374.1 T9SS type A sorting domain-containing protein [Cryomorpha ignava]